jgi:hypothetical protein
VHSEAALGQTTLRRACSDQAPQSETSAVKKTILLEALPRAGRYWLASAALLLFLLPAAASAQMQGPPAPGMPQTKPLTPPPASFHVEYRAGRLSVHALDAPLRRVLAEVVRQSGIQIIGMENVHGRVSVDFSDEPLGPALTSLLIDVDYAFSGDLARPQGIAHATLLVMERHAASAGKGAAPAATTATAAKPGDGTADADADANADPDNPDADADANADPDTPDPDADANAEEDPNAANANPPPAQPLQAPPVYINQSPGQIAQPVPGNPGAPGQPAPWQPTRPPSNPPGNPPGGAGPRGAISFNLASRNVQTLVAAMQSPNPAVQGPAFTNLSAIDSGAAVRAAVAAAKNPDATVRLGALTLLDNSSAAPEGTVLQTLGEALADKDEQVKDYALDALANRGQAAAGYLAPLLKDSDPALRLRVVQDLAGKDWAAPLLKMALKDSDPSVRVAASALVQPAPTGAQ